MAVSYGDISGTKRSFIQMWYDGELVSEPRKGCLKEEHELCGRIMYPGVPAFQNSGCDMDAPLTIGNLFNKHPLRVNDYPHKGMMRHARIFQRALRPHEAVHLYKAMAPALRSFVVPEGEYWVRGDTRYDAAVNRWVCG